MVDLKKFTTDILERSVVTTTGQMIGKLDNLVVNIETGEVANLLVTPEQNTLIPSIERDNEGRYIISVKGIKSMEDVIVVDITVPLKRL